MAQNSSQPLGTVSSRNEGAEGASSSMSPNDGQAADSMGKLSLADGHAVYIGSSHWITILEDIRQLKDDLCDGNSDSTTSEARTPFDDGLTVHEAPVNRISLLYSATSRTREQILAMLPSRKVVDRHVSHFFNTFDFATIILHRKTFIAEVRDPYYRSEDMYSHRVVHEFLARPFGSPYHVLQDVGTFGLFVMESQDMLESYRAATIHCLVAGNYLQPGKYTMEALTLHFVLDQNATLDTSIGNWALIGVVIRIAFRMGLHRDPSHWSNIRPLHAELRRRIWIILYHMDFFTSTQVGLPRMIKDSQCDTRPPVHLFDDDLSLEHNEIPPARPLTESTPLLYILLRDAIIRVTAEIYDTTEAEPPSSAAIVALDAKLQAAIDAIPPWLRYEPLETSLADNPVTILHRMILDILINKAVYLLHRRSFVKGCVGGESKKSNESCIKAALAILEHQRRMNEETEPGGLMFGIRWKVASSLNHEFLQAAMMLCLALSRFNERAAGATTFEASHMREILEALNTAKILWEQSADRSIEAQKAVKALAAVLGQDSDQRTPTLPASERFSEQMSGVVTQSYLGSFDYEQDVALESCFLPTHDDMGVFGSYFEDFVAAGGDETEVRFGGPPTVS
ncbi:hypothetical protein AK830_g11798 [Neonectria ditissima]|uniref:Xylanolytic transcriptional activator regulatory domain-containing protein n=1 Tax=Neonectria ditissima TaxID=78410 RepID=A0A0P7B6Z5_9HYPO|nr:hypothetical protein AK830_g11798 [Neonectria ditissima]